MFGALNRLGVSVKKALSGNAVGSSEPSLAFNFDTNKYVANGTKNFNQAITHARSGNATMVDSDGLIKWAPHNLLKYSEDFSGSGWVAQSGTTVTSNQAVAPDGTLTADLVVGSGTSGLFWSSAGVPDDSNNTKAVWLKGVSGGESVDLKDPAQTVGTVTCSLTTEWQLFSLTEIQSNGLAGIWVNGIPAGGIYVWGAHLYRSNLGGMVNNPARGDSYVPTTSAASYLPRIGHHVYNGTAWANEGMLHESEARTNLVLSGGDLSGFGAIRSSLTSDQATSPTGNVDATAFIEDSTAGNTHIGNLIVGNPVAAGTYTFSVYAKQNGRRYFYTRLNVDAASTNIIYGVLFDLAAGTVVNSGSQGVTTSTNHSIEDVGNGWYRCSVTLGNPSGLRLDVRIALQDSSTFTIGGLGYNGDGVSGVYVYGAQIEAGSTPSSYIPTSGATATRAADVLTIPAANMPWPQPEYIGPELVDNASEPDDWVQTESNLIEADGDAIKFTFVNASTGGSLTLTDAAALTTNLTSGSVYQITGEVKINSGLAGLTVVSAFSSENKEFTNTEFDQFSVVFTADGSNETFRIINMSVGEIAWVRNISVREINPLSVSIQMDGRMTYADTGKGVGPNDTTGEVILYRWRSDTANFIVNALNTGAAATGGLFFMQEVANLGKWVYTGDTYYSPSTNVPVNIASRHGSTFVNGAVDGTALTANTTPVALTDLSAADFDLGYDFMGTIGTFRVWAQDLTDEGIVDATEPSLEPSLSLTFDSTESSFIVEDWT